MVTILLQLMNKWMWKWKQKYVVFYSDAQFLFGTIHDTSSESSAWTDTYYQHKLKLYCYVEELETNLMSLVIFIELNICSTCFEH